jgi:hypothetical protein
MVAADTAHGHNAQLQHAIAVFPEDRMVDQNVDHRIEQPDRLLGKSAHQFTPLDRTFLREPFCDLACEP